MRRVALGLFAMAVCAGCSDPYEPSFGDSLCKDGMELDRGACTAPKRTMKIDGDFSDWAGLTQLHAPTSGLGLELARDAEAGLLVRIVTDGAPETGPDVLYDIELVGSSYVVHIGVSSGNDGWFYQEGKTDQQLGTSPALVAFGDSGLEVRIPIDVIPLPGEANIDVQMFHRQKGNTFAGQPQSNELGPVDCWDPHRRQNSCAHH